MLKIDFFASLSGGINAAVWMWGFLLMFAGLNAVGHFIWTFVAVVIDAFRDARRQNKTGKLN